MGQEAASEQRQRSERRFRRSKLVNLGILVAHIGEGAPERPLALVWKLLAAQSSHHGRRAADLLHKRVGRTT